MAESHSRSDRNCNLRPSQGMWPTNEDPKVHGSELEMARHKDNTDEMKQKEYVNWNSSEN